MSCASPEQRPAEAERRPRLTGDSMWEKMIAYILTHGEALAVQIGTHLWISLAALAAAILIGAPCGYLAADFLLNTIVGFRDVPPFMTESAAGIGMTDREILWKVRIPLALPMIFAGIRTALVEVIASAALAARIGAGGLGEVIFTGLGLNRMDLLLLGGTLVAALSLLCGGLFDALTRRLMPYRLL